MATENQKTILEGNTSEVPSDHELFVGDVYEADPKADKSTLGICEELSERQVFAGDEDFYERLADFVQPTVTEQPARQSEPPLPVWHRPLSTIQKVLIVSIVLTGAMLLYTLLKSPPESVVNFAPTPAVQQTPSQKPPVEDAVSRLTAPQQQIRKLEPAPDAVQPLSLKVAETFYLQKDYNKAYAAYEQLRQSLPVPIVSIQTEEELLKDFLQLKKAFCMERMADSDAAGRLFRTVLQSRSPVVRAVANYHCSLIEMQKKQYLKARTRAYKTIAIIDAVDYGGDWALSLQRDCHFLVAELITRNVLSLCDADKGLPEDLWGNLVAPLDPFTNLSEPQLRSFLNSGSERLGKGLLGPQIQRLTSPGTSGTPSWSVICRRAPIEELLARFAANADLDIQSAIDNWQSQVGKRPISLYLPATTSQQFVSVAAGCVGLLAHLDDKGAINIFNPDDYSSLSEHISLLGQEAISLWQRFLLTFHDDERLGNAHFALGLLKSQRARIADAIAEYKLVANRFSQTSLAPFALLHSGKLKTNLRDYAGAQEDLRQLVEQYPDNEIAGHAYLYLADATMKAQLYDEAARLYRKVYYLDSSLQSRAASTIGAARCFYERKDYQSAAKWLTRYISLARDRANRESYFAYFLLGKTNLALGRPEAACEAFRYALAGELTKQEYVETVSALVKGHMDQKNFVEALDILEDVRSVAFSQKESVEILLLKSKILRAMGLVDKAIVVLGDRAEYISDPQLKARVSFELTKCYIAEGNLELARGNLAEILVLVDPGPLAHEIALKLADVCLKLDQNSQTISICSQLLDSPPSSQIKQKALSILATAYGRQKNYDRAALALLGQWNGIETPNEKAMFDDPTITGQSLHQAQ